MWWDFILNFQSCDFPRRLVAWRVCVDVWRVNATPQRRPPLRPKPDCPSPNAPRFARDSSVRPPSWSRCHLNQFRRISFPSAVRVFCLTHARYLRRQEWFDTTGMCRRDTFHLQGQRSNAATLAMEPHALRLFAPNSRAPEGATPGTNQATDAMERHLDRLHLLNHSLGSVHPTPAPPHRWPLTGACPGVYLLSLTQWLRWLVCTLNFSERTLQKLFKEGQRSSVPITAVVWESFYPQKVQQTQRKFIGWLKLLGALWRCQNWGKAKIIRPSTIKLPR